MEEIEEVTEVIEEVMVVIEGVMVVIEGVMAVIEEAAEATAAIEVAMVVEVVEVNKRQI